MLEWTLDSRFKVRVGVRRETALEVVIPKLATVGEIWEIAVRGRVGVWWNGVCVVPVTCLSLELVLRRHFFLRRHSFLPSLPRHSLSSLNSSHQSVRK